MSDEREREFGELKAKVDDLMRWRDVFEADIKSEVQDIRKEMNSGMKEIRDLIAHALQVATNRLPVWAAITGGVILAIAGWFVEWSLFHH